MSITAIGNPPASRRVDVVEVILARGGLEVRAESRPQFGGAHSAGAQPVCDREQMDGPSGLVHHECPGAVADVGDGLPEGHSEVDRVGVVHNFGNLDYPALVHILDELGDIPGGGFGEDLFGGADLDHCPVFHYAHPVADAQSLVQVVGDEQDGLAEFVLDFHQLVLHLAPDERIEGGEGFVHQEDGGVGRQRPGKSHPLLHAAREMAGVGAGVGFQSH